MRLYKTSDPRGGAIFDTSYILNNLGRNSPDEATFLGLLVSGKKIFKVFPYMNLCKTSDPRAGPFLTPGL